MTTLTNVAAFFLLLVSFIGMAFCIRYFAHAFSREMRQKRHSVAMPYVIPPFVYEEILKKLKGRCIEECQFSDDVDYLWNESGHEYFIYMDFGYNFEWFVDNIEVYRDESPIHFTFDEKKMERMLEATFQRVTE